MEEGRTEARKGGRRGTGTWSEQGLWGFCVSVFFVRKGRSERIEGLRAQTIKFTRQRGGR